MCEKLDSDRRCLRPDCVRRRLMAARQKVDDTRADVDRANLAASAAHTLHLNAKADLERVPPLPGDYVALYPCAEISDAVEEVLEDKTRYVYEPIWRIRGRLGGEHLVRREGSYDGMLLRAAPNKKLRRGWREIVRESDDDNDDEEGSL